VSEETKQLLIILSFLALMVLIPAVVAISGAK
jgi:hypothetical protein